MQELISKILENNKYRAPKQEEIDFYKWLIEWMEEREELVELVQAKDGYIDDLEKQVEELKHDEPRLIEDDPEEENDLEEKDERIADLEKSLERRIARERRQDERILDLTNEAHQAVRERDERIAELESQIHYCPFCGKTGEPCL